MGVGVAGGDGVGADVKGGWRINVFLFFLTGWQAVLLPWLPLLLKTAGFSALGVGVVTGVGTLVSSVGVGACLGGVRRTRSGALRRLLLLVLLAAATALQVAAVALLQQRGAAGGLHSCHHPHLPPPTLSSSSITSSSLTSSSPASTPAFSGPSPTVDRLGVGATEKDATGLLQPGGTTSLRQPGGTTSLRQPAGTTSLRQPDNTTSLRQPDGTTSLRQPGGTTSLRQPGGTTSLRQPGGTTSLRQPGGKTSLRQPDGTTSLRQPGGTTSLRQPDNTTSLRQPGGTTSLRQPGGTTSLRQPDNTTSLRQPGGTTSLRQPGGTTSLRQPGGTTSLRQPGGTTSLRQPGGTTSLRQPGGTTLYKPSATTTTTTAPYNLFTTPTHDFLNSQTSGEKDSQVSVKDDHKAGAKGQDTGDASQSSHGGQEDKPGGKKLTTPWYTNLLSGRDQSVAETKPLEDNPEAPEHRTRPEGSTDDRKTTSPAAGGPGDPDNSDQASDEEDLDNANESEEDIGDDRSSHDDEGDHHYYSYADYQQGDDSSLDSFSSRLQNFPSHNSYSKYPKPDSSGKSSKSVSSQVSSRVDLPKTPAQIPGVPWSPGSWLPTATGLRRQHLINTNHKTQSSQGNPVVADKHIRPGDTLRASGQGKPPVESYTNTQGLRKPQVPPPPPHVRSSDDAEHTLPDAGSRWQETSPYHRLHHQSPYSLGFPSRPALPAGQTGSSGGQHDLLGHGARSSGWRGHHRGRRSLHQPGVEHKAHDPGTTADLPSQHEVTTTKSRDNSSQTDLGEGLSDGVGVQTGVAVLLIVGGLVGVGVEAAVAQLWHCYTHGYDEGGVSQDILQRTITHTFQLSAYASHRSWSGVTSGAWVVGGGVVSLLACMVGVETGAYGGLAGVHLALGVCALALMLVLPIPYGAVDPPRTRRPLSLYLDDEVLREGLRRLAFHAWVFTNGCLAAFSLTYSLFLLQEMTAQGVALASQTVAVAVSLGSEGASLLAHRWLMTRCGLQGTMGVAGLALTLHFSSMWGASGSVAVVVFSHAGLGLALAAMWIAIKYNALLLATVTDQEREAWASWWAWRVGLGVGAAVWGLCVEGVGGKVRPLLPHATVITALMGAAVGLAAALTRHHWRSRRRVYHTLDLDMAEDDDEDDEEPFEDDWLVKRAKKEGITL